MAFERINETPARVVRVLKIAFIRPEHARATAIEGAIVYIKRLFINFLTFALFEMALRII